VRRRAGLRSGVPAATDERADRRPNELQLRAIAEPREHARPVPRVDAVIEVADVILDQAHTRRRWSRHVRMPTYAQIPATTKNTNASWPLGCVNIQKPTSAIRRATAP